jgi:methyl-accepting chemotaxis protein
LKKKLAAWFLTVAMLYTIVGVVVPRLQPDPVWSTILIVSSDIVIGLGAAWLVSHVLTRRLRDLASAATVISRGDLTRTVALSEARDEAADLARSFSTMVESLLNVVAEVRSTSDRIHESALALSATSEEMNAATEEIAAAAQAIALGAERQAEQVSETSAITRDLTRSVEDVASSAREVHGAAREATQRAAAGAEDARRAADGIGALADTIASAAAAVEGFRLKSEEIGKIVAFIRSLSQQTHLLAINAAIESARAGEEARGFGVVAEEVRRIADDVSGFAQQISSLSDEIHQGSNDVAAGIRQSVGAADAARDLVERASGSFEGILASIRGTETRSADISRLTEKQRGAAEHVARSLEQISRIAEQNATGTEETSSATVEQTASMQEMAASVHALARTSDHLKELISLFKVG